MTAYVPIHSGTPETDFARAVLAMQSVAAPGQKSTTPALAVTAGVKGKMEKFTISPETLSSTRVTARLQYNPRLFAATNNLKQSIVPLTSTTTAKFANTPTAVPTPAPASLDEYLYDQALAAGAVPTLQIDTMGTAEIVLTKVFNTPMASLLTGAMGGGGGGNL